MFKTAVDTEETVKDLETREAESAGFRELYLETYPAVYKYVFRRLRTDVDDVVEDTFVTAWRRRSSTPSNPDEHLLWLYGIARRLIANRVRLHSRRGRFVREMEPISHTASSTEDAAVASVMVHAALGRMKHNDREILLLVEWDGLSVDQSARVLGINSTTATKRLAAARQQFKQLCGDQRTSSSD